MPAISPQPYKPNNRDLNEAVNKELTVRRAAIDLFWSYYDGSHRKWLKADPITGQDSNITLNECGRACDKMSEFVGTPTGMKIEEVAKVEGASNGKAVGSKTTTSPAQDELDAQWKRHAEMTPEIVQSGLIAGHVFLKLYFNEKGEPCYTLLDPRMIAICWDVTMPRKPLFYRLQWKMGETSYRQDIIPNWMLDQKQTTTPEEQADKSILDITPEETITGWTIIDYRSWGYERWRVLSTQEWDYDFAPIVEWASKRRPHTYYGIGMLDGKIGLNDALNFLASNTARIIMHHAHPKTFVFGTPLDEKTEVGGYWDDLPIEARVETLEMTNPLDSSMKFMDELKAEFFSAVRVLDTATIKDQIGRITNFGVRMLYDDQIEAREDLTASYGAGLAEAHRRMLVMSGTVVDAPIIAEWTEPLPTNRLEVLQGVQIEAQLGTTSKETLADDLGRDYEAEQEKIQEEGGNSMSSFVDALTRGGKQGLFGSPQQANMNGRGNALAAGEPSKNGMNSGYPEPAIY